MSSTALSNTASFAFDGLVEPLTFRTYWSAAARISSDVAAGSKLWSVLMFLHMSSPFYLQPVAMVSAQQTLSILSGPSLQMRSRK
jgi:hypothetical protein